jgi:hypothetical protein
MDITRLRILTLKSKAFFYYDKNWTVEKLISDKSFLVMKAYYEQEKISFNQEVLDILKEKYPRFFEIEKPSKLMDWYSKVMNVEAYENMTHERLLRIHNASMAKKGVSNPRLRNELKKKKAEKIRKEIETRLVISKRDLQAKNHGK